MSKNKKVKYLPGIGLVRTAKESKILPDCGEKQSCYVCEKATECKQKKVESEADEFKKKYPEIAKMTVAEVVATMRTATSRGARKMCLRSTISLLKNEVLAKTCEGMVSPDYKERFKAEYIQLYNRLGGLKLMVRHWDAGTLNFTPTCPREIYDKQIEGMQTYLDVLTERAKMEAIDLSDIL